MRIYLTKEFARFARKAGLESGSLRSAAAAVANGRWDADLGGGVFKQRIARQGGGKSGGFRTIIVYRCGGHSFFIFGFAKSSQASVSPKELLVLRKLGQSLLNLRSAELRHAVDMGELVEVSDNGTDVREV